MSTKLNGKRAIVTGGSSGIGAAIADALFDQGAEVHVLDVNTVEGTDGRFYHQCDITNEEQVGSTVEHITQRGAIDILINNAGIGFVGNIEKTSSEDMDRLYQVNVKGIFHCTKFVISHMRERGGVILNMASIAASVGLQDRFAYSMTKGAVLAMTYSLAKDYIGDGIRCNSISPARVHTTFVDNFIKKNYPGQEAEVFEKLSNTQPIGRMGKPEEIASLVLYLCSDEAAFVTGTDFPIDGGFIKLNGS